MGREAVSWAVRGVELPCTSEGCLVGSSLSMLALLCLQADLPWVSAMCCRPCVVPVYIRRMVIEKL